MRGNRTGWSVVGIAVVSGFAAMQAEAKTFDESYAAAVKNNPTGVIFEIKLPQKTFRMGEVIPIDLTFSSTAKERWQIDGGLHDRSGRMSEDTYRLDPADGAHDPLEGYFEGGIFGGGLRQMPILTDKPHVMHFDLNEWQRIDRPGKYRLYVSSFRLTDQSQKPEQRRTVAAASNILEFEVLPPDEKWQREQLAEIIAAIDTAQGEKARSAARRLRFLGTSECALELARRFNGSENDVNYMFGLYGLRDRPAAIRAMRQRFVAPDQPVTGMYLQTLGHLEALQADGTTRPASTTPDAYAAWWKQRQKRREAATNQAAGDLVEEIAKKVGRAKAVSVYTSLAMQRSLPEPQRQTLRAILPEVFMDLPLDWQCDALENRWDAIRSPGMLPVLLRLYQQPPKARQSDWHDAATLIDWCLRRTYELNPERVRPLILAALKDPRGKLKSRSMRSLLLALPDQTLPELDENWAAALEQDHSLDGQDLLSRLIARYGTDKPLPRIKAFYAKAPGRWACDMQASLLAYFLRVEPAYGQEQVRTCLAARGKNYSRCWASLLQDVSQRIWTPELETVCIEALLDPEAEVVQSAAAALAEHASTPTKEKMLAALAVPWTPAPPRKEDSLQPKNPREAREYALVHAITTARAWLLADEEMDHLKTLLTSADAKEALARHREARKGKITIQLQTFDSGESQAYLLDEDLRTLAALEAKMLQFPKGTVFTLAKDDSDNKDPIHSALRAWAKQHGLTIDNAAIREP